MQERRAVRRPKDAIELREGTLVARVLDPNTKGEIRRAGGFRHNIFREELRWLLEDTGPAETDRYDDGASHFGVFSESGELVGYCRLILPETGFMIESEFAELVDPGYRIRKEEDTVEMSRFAIPSHLRGDPRGFEIISLLLRSVYSWAILNRVRYFYGVCATDHLAFVQTYFTCCEAIGPVYEYQPGVPSAALVFDLANLDLEKVGDFWALVVGKSR